MAFIPNQNQLGVGDKVKNLEDISSCGGTFEKGTELYIMGVDQIRGYTVRDIQGNMMYEAGFNFVKI